MKKLIHILLSLMMIFSFVPTNVFAQENIMLTSEESTLWPASVVDYEFINNAGSIDLKLTIKTGSDENGLPVTSLIELYDGSNCIYSSNLHKPSALTPGSNLSMTISSTSLTNSFETNKTYTIKITSSTELESKTTNDTLNCQVKETLAGDITLSTSSLKVGGSISVVGSNLNTSSSDVLNIQWLRNGFDIPGATGSTYQTVDEDANNYISVRITTPSKEGYVDSASVLCESVPKHKVTFEINAGEYAYFQDDSNAYTTGQFKEFHEDQYVYINGDNKASYVSFSSNDVELSTLGSDTRYFKMPNHDVTIHVNYCKHTSIDYKTIVVATCEEDGYTLDAYCTLCGYVLDPGKKITPAKGHESQGNYKLNTKATFTKDGEMVSTCVRCEKELSTPISKVSVVELENTTFIFNDEEIKPNVIIKNEKGVPLSKDSYDITYTNNKSVGTGHVIVTLKGNYEGTKTLDFTIKQTTGSWIEKDGKWWYRHNDGSYTKNNWEKIDDQWFYFDGSGYRVVGWNKINNKWYYMDNQGVMVTGFHDIDGNKYYFGSSGVMATGWIKIDGYWYYLQNGVAQNDLVKISGKWYLFKDYKMQTYDTYFNDFKYSIDTKGVVKTGWVKNTHGQWNYIDPDTCQYVSNKWMKIGNVWYYFDNYNMSTGKKVIDGIPYLFEENGKLKTGWNKEGEDWLYYTSSGVVNGWKSINSKWYYFDHYIMVKGIQTIDGVIYNMTTGAMATTASWYKNSDGSYYYFQANGKAASAWLKVGTKWYYFDLDTKLMVHDETRIIDGVTYQFASNGTYTKI